MTVVLVILLVICAFGWLKCSIAAEAMADWIKKSGSLPTTEEIRILAHEVIERRFRVKAS